MSFGISEVRMETQSPTQGSNDNWTPTMHLPHLPNQQHDTDQQKWRPCFSHMATVSLILPYTNRNKNITVLNLLAKLLWSPVKNKANLRDLIAATGLVILLKFHPNRRFFVPCDLEIWWMTLENNRAPLLHYIKLCLSFQIHWWIETEVTVRKRSIRVKIGDFLSCVTLKFDGWPWKTIGHLFYTTSSFVYHFIPIGEFKLELQSGNAQFGSKSTIFRAVRPWNLMDDLAKQ